MSKLQEILCKNFDVELSNYYDNELGIATAIEDCYHRTSDPIRIEEAMREYAEYYAKQCLMIAAENAKIINKQYIASHLNNKEPFYSTTQKIDKESIFNIELPKHK